MGSGPSCLLSGCFFPLLRLPGWPSVLMFHCGPALWPHLWGPFPAHHYFVITVTLTLISPLLCCPFVPRMGRAWSQVCCRTECVLSFPFRHPRQSLFSQFLATKCKHANMALWHTQGVLWPFISIVSACPLLETSILHFKTALLILFGKGEVEGEGFKALLSTGKNWRGRSSWIGTGKWECRPWHIKRLNCCLANGARMKGPLVSSTTKNAYLHD